MCFVEKAQFFGKLWQFGEQGYGFERALLFLHSLIKNINNIVELVFKSDFESLCLLTDVLNKAWLSENS